MKAMTSKTQELLEKAYQTFEGLVKKGERKWKAQDLKYAETGVGTATEFKGAVKEGYFVNAQKPRPFHVQKWRLTDKGIALLLEWKESRK